MMHHCHRGGTCATQPVRRHRRVCYHHGGSLGDGRGERIRERCHSDHCRCQTDELGHLHDYGHQWNAGVCDLDPNFDHSHDGLFVRSIVDDDELFQLEIEVCGCTRASDLSIDLVENEKGRRNLVVYQAHGNDVLFKKRFNVGDDIDPATLSATTQQDILTIAATKKEKGLEKVIKNIGITEGLK